MYGVELRELERDAKIDLSIFDSVPMSPSPLMGYSACFSDPEIARLGEEIGVTAVFDGELGDNVFGRNIHNELLGEIAGTIGMRPAALPVLFDYAVFRRISFWKALRLAWSARSAKVAPVWDSIAYAANVLGTDPLSSRFAAAPAWHEHLATAGRFRHPWMRDLEGIPSGKLLLLYGMAAHTSCATEPPFRSLDGPSPASPYASQPVVEVALRIPSHFHIKGGMDRAVARRAFASQLAPDVYRRGNAKGGPILWATGAIENNISYVRERLLDGLLVKERLLDRNKIEQALSPDNLFRTAGVIPEIFLQLYIECWLQRWNSVRSSLAGQFTVADDVASRRAFAQLSPS